MPSGFAERVETQTGEGQVSGCWGNLVSGLLYWWGEEGGKGKGERGKGKVERGKLTGERGKGKGGKGTGGRV